MTYPDDPDPGPMTPGRPQSGAAQPAAAHADSRGVVIADDHPVYRDGIVRAVGRWPGLHVAGEAQTGTEALELVRRGAALAVLDLRMPDVTGLEVLERLQREQLPTKVLLLSAWAEDEAVYTAIARGARGFLAKSATPQVVCEALMGIDAGEVVLDAHVQAGLSRRLQERAVRRTDPLSPREREVLRLTADGGNARAVGEALHLSTSTVKSHLTSIYEKLEVNDRAEAVAIAMRLGWIE